MMSKRLKIPAIPKFIPRKYHHEIKCILEQFQNDILIGILKKANLSDDAFVEISTFSRFADTPTAILDAIKDIAGNTVSKRLFEIRTKKAEARKEKNWDAF